MEYNKNQEVEQGISVGQVLAVLFGRKITLFSVWGGVFLIGLLILKFGLEPNQMVYTSDFSLNNILLETEKYTDGQDINIYSLVTKDNVTRIGLNAGISKKAAESIYYSNRFVVKRVEETTVVNQETIVTPSFHIELPTKQFKNENQVRTFMQGIADLINEKQNNILTTQLNNQYLELYSQANTYDLQVLYLENQYNLLTKRYESLIATYGDVFLADNAKLSDKKTEIEEYFENHSLETYSNQIKVRGYVKGYKNEKDYYEAEKAALVDEKANAKLKLDDLIAQREELINTASNLQTVELSEYNSTIIELTISIRDMDTEIASLDFKIENLDKLATDDALKEEIQKFQNDLATVKSKLDDFTNTYDQAAEYVAKNNSITYFESTSIVSTSNKFGIVKLVAFPLAFGLIIALIVNLFLDGKKLTGKYKLVPVSMVKELNEEEKEDENKTA